MKNFSSTAFVDGAASEFFHLGPLEAVQPTKIWFGSFSSLPHLANISLCTMSDALEQAEQLIPCEVRMISGCRDEQTSADGKWMSPN